MHVAEDDLGGPEAWNAAASPKAFLGWGVAHQKVFAEETWDTAARTPLGGRHCWGKGSPVLPQTENQG